MTETTPRTAAADKPVRKKHRPRAGTAQRRQEILDAAMKVFATKGFHAGTLNDVAELVGMTHAGVLHHFGSKENLLQAVIDHRDSVDSSEAHAAYGLDFFKHLIATATLNATRPGIVQTYVVLSAEAVTDGNPGADYFTGRFEGLRELVVSQLRALTPSDDPLSDKELNSAASNIIALMDGLQVQWLLNPDSVDLVDATVFGINAIVARVIAGGSAHPVLTGPDSPDQS
ncbi:MAG: TetR/AcrR family transcriptional regulator [Propionibacteriaceae bacterium]|jgi:AcrR family transcriptional regulator|nr:TetR/AcrR family transcriptional regulator [Propionibacteriaceae bacterium]